MQKQFQAGLIYKGNGLFESYCFLQTEDCDKHFEAGKLYLADFPGMTTERQRTAAQRRSMWLYLTKIAKRFRSAGITLQGVIEKMRGGYEIECTKDNLKSIMWDEIQISLYGKSSSQDLSTVENSEVYEACNVFTARFGITEPYPDQYTQSLEQVEQSFQSANK